MQLNKRCKMAAKVGNSVCLTLGNSSCSTVNEVLSSKPCSTDFSSLAAVTCNTSCEISFCWNLVRLPSIPEIQENIDLTFDRKTTATTTVISTSQKCLQQWWVIKLQLHATAAVHNDVGRHRCHYYSYPCLYHKAWTVHTTLNKSNLSKWPLRNRHRGNKMTS